MGMTNCHIGVVDKNELRRVRERLNMTQTELAKELDVDIRTVIRWEKDGNIPKTVELAVKQIVADRR